MQDSIQPSFGLQTSCPQTSNIKLRVIKRVNCIHIKIMWTFLKRPSSCRSPKQPSPLAHPALSTLQKIKHDFSVFRRRFWKQTVMKPCLSAFIYVAAALGSDTMFPSRVSQSPYQASEQAWLETIKEARRNLRSSEKSNLFQESQKAFGKVLDIHRRSC